VQPERTAMGIAFIKAGIFVAMMGVVMFIVGVITYLVLSAWEEEND
jgi:hypothetical protein